MDVFAPSMLGPQLIWHIQFEIQLLVNLLHLHFTFPITTHMNTLSIEGKQLRLFGELKKLNKDFLGNCSMTLFQRTPLELYRSFLTVTNTPVTSLFVAWIVAATD